MFKIMPILYNNSDKRVFLPRDWQVNCRRIVVRDSVSHKNLAQSESCKNGKTLALIVDDEKDICYLLSCILRQKNIVARQANSLSEAEQIIEKELPPVIFLDNHLLDGLGISTIKKFKIKAPNSKIVMITAYDNASDRSKAQEAGVDYFIGKPFTKELIFRALEIIV